MPSPNPFQTRPAWLPLQQALRLAAPHHTRSEISEILAIRVSSKSRQTLNAHLDEGSRLYADHPVVGPWLESLPEDILTNPDDSYRLAHGLVRIEMRHCHEHAIGGARVGYAAVAHNDGKLVLVLLIAHSGADEDIETPTGAINAWAELVVAAWEWACTARKLRFQREDRMNRSNAVFVRINDAVKDRPGGRYYWNTKEINPHTDSWQAITTSNKSSEEATEGKRRRLGGKLRKLQRGGWETQVPAGLRRAKKTDENGWPVEDHAGPLTADLSRTEELTIALTGYERGHSKTKIAIDAALLGARDGQGALLLPLLAPVMCTKATSGKDLRQRACALAEQWHARGSISDVELDRVRSAMKLTSTAPRREKATLTANHYVTRIVDAVPWLRTGTIEVVRFGHIQGCTDYLGWTPTFVTNDLPTSDDQTDAFFIAESDLPAEHPYHRFNAKKRKRARTHGFWLFRMDYGTPVVLSPQAWDAIEERRRRDADERARRAASGRCRPLAGLRSGRQEAHPFRIKHGGDSATYYIETPVLIDGEQTWEHVHTVGATDATRRLGELVLELVDRADAGPLPLLPSPNDLAAIVDPLEYELESLRGRLADEMARLDQHVHALAGLQPGTAAHQATERARDAAGAEAELIQSQLLPALEARLADPTRTAREPEPAEEPGEFGHLALVGLGLLRCDPHGPAALSDAVTWLLDSGAGLTNLRCGDRDRQILIDVHVRIPLADGSVEWADAGTLDLTDRRLSPDRRVDFAADCATRFLRDGERPGALATRYGWSEAKVLSRTADWLSSVGLDNHYLRAAVVTASAAHADLPVGPVLFATLTGDEGTLAEIVSRHGQWIVDQIQKAYGPAGSWAHGTGWVRKPLAQWRALQLGLAAAGPAKVAQAIASVQGIDNHERLQDHLVPGRCSHWQPPVQLEAGWVRPLRCAHPDCPGGVGAPLTGFLPVPELLVAGAAVFCTHCWRSPAATDQLPEPYRKLWDVASSVASLQRADGIPCIAGSGATPSLGVSLLTTREGAALLGCRTHTLRALAVEGLVPSTRTTSGDLRFHAAQIDTPRVRSLLSDAHPTLEQDDSVLLVGTKEAAARLGTKPGSIRRLVAANALANHGDRSAPAYDVTEIEIILANLHEQAGNPAATLADFASPQALVDRWEVTLPTVKRVLATGLLPEVRVGDMTFVPLGAVTELDRRTRAALDPSLRLTTSYVAARAECSEATVTTHVVDGHLTAVQLYPRGRYYFVEEDVERWLAWRKAAGGSTASS